VEFERLIPLLTDPGRFGGDPVDAFTVVAPWKLRFACWAMRRAGATLLPTAALP